METENIKAKKSIPSAKFAYFYLVYIRSPFLKKLDFPHVLSSI